MMFLKHDSGLYVYKYNPTNDRVTGYRTMISTVAKQEQLFSRREIKAADTARDLYRKIGRPAEAKFVEILKRNGIQNCPVAADDAKRALIIYGPDIAMVNGKTSRTEAAPRAPTFFVTSIPTPILKHHKMSHCAWIFLFRVSRFSTPYRETSFLQQKYYPPR